MTLVFGAFRDIFTFVKILYLITKSNWGGAQRNVYDLATAMKAAGHEVKAAVGGAGILKNRLEAAGIYTYPIASMGRDISVGKDAGSFKEIWNVIRTQRPDILHLHSPKAAGLGALAGRLLRVKKIVMTVHGWTWNENRPLHQKGLIVLASWLTALLCHDIIVICNHDLEQGQKLPGVKEKLRLVPIGIKPAVLLSVDGAKQAVAKMTGLPHNEFDKMTIIGSIAELHRNKGLNYLVEAMTSVVTKHPNAVCIIMSDGEERERLQTQIRERNLDRNFYLVGYVENAAEYLKAFSIFVLPSLKEGLPYVLLEAGAAGIPVISTTVGGIPDIIHDMNSGILIQPKSARDLAHALMFALEHPKERKEQAAKLKAHVLGEFSLDKMIKTISEIYAQA